MEQGKLIVIEGACDGIGKTTQFEMLANHFKEDKQEIIHHHFPSYGTYQAALIENLEQKKKFLDYVIDFEYQKIGIKEPDNVIFLHAPFELVTEMRNARKQNEGIENDIHESNLDFMKKVYENAMFIADYLSWDKIQCNNGNKMREINDIHEEVYSLVKKRK